MKRENRTKIIVVKVIGSGIPDDPYRVDLPTYIIVKELNRKPDGKFPINNGRVMVAVPDYYLNDKGKLDKDKIRKVYRKTKWDNPDVGNGVEVD